MTSVAELLFIIHASMYIPVLIQHNEAFWVCPPNMGTGILLPAFPEGKLLSLGPWPITDLERSSSAVLKSS